MEVSAKLQGVRMAPQKVRLVADQIRGLHVENALDLLTFSVKKAASIIKKTLNSAINNAEMNHNLDIDSLFVTKIYVDEGPTAKRLNPRAKGRGDRILKRSCHITVVVSE